MSTSAPRFACSSSDLERVAGTRLCGDSETVTLAKDCGGVKMLPLATVAGSSADWTEEMGMDSRAGNVGGSMVTRYYDSLGDIERQLVILEAFIV